MIDSEDGGSAQFACQIDLGFGRRLDIELAGGNKLWAAVGGGINNADLWMKDVASGMDVRVRLTRLDHGLQITIDRGEQQVPWWSRDGSPRLTLSVDSLGGTASVSASVGNDQQFQTVALGEVKLES